jgi:hypothetical protein
MGVKMPKWMPVSFERERLLRKKKEEQARRNKKGHLADNYGKASVYELKE